MVVNINREQLLPALIIVSGAVERKQTLPILGNFLIKVKSNRMQVIATDLEVEIQVSPILEDADEDMQFT
ncbi:hypothetical protein TI04_06095, partial [Achromatium sp. WMS2]